MPKKKYYFHSCAGTFLTAGQLIDELLRDHETIRRALPQLEARTGLGKQIFDLGDLLERHIRREERELFPLFEQHAGEVDADKIGAAIN